MTSQSTITQQPGQLSVNIREEGEFKKSAWDFWGSRTRTTALKRHSVSGKQRF